MEQYDFKLPRSPKCPQWRIIAGYLGHQKDGPESKPGMHVPTRVACLGGCTLKDHECSLTIFPMQTLLPNDSDRDRWKVAQRLSPVEVEASVHGLKRKLNNGPAFEFMILSHQIFNQMIIDSLRSICDRANER